MSIITRSQSTPHLFERRARPSLVRSQSALSGVAAIEERPPPLIMFVGEDPFHLAGFFPREAGESWGWLRNGDDDDECEEESENESDQEVGWLSGVEADAEEVIVSEDKFGLTGLALPLRPLAMRLSGGTSPVVLGEEEEEAVWMEYVSSFGMNEPGESVEGLHAMLCERRQSKTKFGEKDEDGALFFGGDEGADAPSFVGKLTGVVMRWIWWEK